MAEKDKLQWQQQQHSFGSLIGTMSILSPQEHKDVLSLKSIDLTVGGPAQFSILSSCCAYQERHLHYFMSISSPLHERTQRDLFIKMSTFTLNQPCEPSTIVRVTLTNCTILLLISSIGKRRRKYQQRKGKLLKNPDVQAHLNPVQGLNTSILKCSMRSNVFASSCSVLCSLSWPRMSVAFLVKTQQKLHQKMNALTVKPIGGKQKRLTQ